LYAENKKATVTEITVDLANDPNFDRKLRMMHPLAEKLHPLSLICTPKIKKIILQALETINSVSLLQ